MTLNMRNLDTDCIYGICECPSSDVVTHSGEEGLSEMGKGLASLSKVLERVDQASLYS
jgi:hypothetical protein